MTVSLLLALPLQESTVWDSYTAFFISIAMCFTRTRTKRNTYNSARTVMLCDEGGN